MAVSSNRAWAAGACAALALSLAGSLGCGARQVPATHTPAARATAPATSESPAEARWRNLPRLHPRARQLIGRESAELTWARDGSLALSPAHCADALQQAAGGRGGCTLVALGGGRAAVLVAHAEPGCARSGCIERSWVFLRAHARALALPSRRVEDYEALAADLPRERATTLWLAGFRAYGDGRVVAGEAPLEPSARIASRPAQVSDYARCTLDPSERELLCPLTTGALVAIDPARATQRVLTTHGG